MWRTVTKSRIIKISFFSSFPLGEAVLYLLSVLWLRFLLYGTNWDSVLSLPKEPLPHPYLLYSCLEDWRCWNGTLKNVDSICRARLVKANICEGKGLMSGWFLKAPNVSERFRCKGKLHTHSSRLPSTISFVLASCFLRCTVPVSSYTLMLLTQKHSSRSKGVRDSLFWSQT